MVVVEVAIVVGDVLGKHVIDGHRDLVPNRYGGTIVATARLKAVELVTQIGSPWPELQN
jgi:hypothetical protein